MENVDDADGKTRYVFGHIDQTTTALTTRFNYTMTPNLSLQVYAEPFVSAGAYSGFKELVDGRAPRYEDRYRPTHTASNPDFNYRSFRTTNVLALGIQARLDALHRLAAEQASDRRVRRFQLRPRLTAVSSRRRRTTSSW